MVYRLVYRYDMIFHDRNFLSIMKKMLKSFKKLVKFNAKIILKVIFTLHIQILSMDLNSIRKMVKKNQNYTFFEFCIFENDHMSNRNVLCWLICFFLHDWVRVLIMYLISYHWLMIMYHQTEDQIYSIDNVRKLSKTI